MAESKKKIQGKTAKEWFDEGVKKIKAKQWDDAIECFTNTIELNPRSAEAHSNLGAAWSKRGELDKAIQYLNRAIELNPDDAKAYNNRGITWSKRGEYDKAIEDFDKAIELNPDYIKAISNRGKAILERETRKLTKQFTDDKEYLKERSKKERRKARRLGWGFYFVLFFLLTISLSVVSIILYKTSFLAGLFSGEFSSKTYFPITESFSLGVISFPIIWALRRIKVAQENAEVLSELFFNLAFIEERITLFAQKGLDDWQQEIYGAYFKKIIERGPEEVLLEIFQGKQDDPPTITPSQLAQNLVEDLTEKITQKTIKSRLKSLTKRLTKDSSTN